MPLQNTAEIAAANDHSTNPADTDMVLCVPGLNQIPLGEYSLGVPIQRGRVQVGMRGTPDGFDRLRVHVSPDEIQITRTGGDLQIESGVLHKGEDGHRSVVRTLVLDAPEGTIRFRRIDGQWTTTTGRVSSPLGMVRFAAKIGEAAINKDKKAKLKKEHVNKA